MSKEAEAKVIWRSSCQESEGPSSRQFHWLDEDGLLKLTLIVPNAKKSTPHFAAQIRVDKRWDVVEMKGGQIVYYKSPEEAFGAFDRYLKGVVQEGKEEVIWHAKEVFQKFSSPPSGQGSKKGVESNRPAGKASAQSRKKGGKSEKQAPSESPKKEEKMATATTEQQGSAADKTPRKVVEIPEEDVRRLMVELGESNVASWDDDKLFERIDEIPERQKQFDDYKPSTSKGQDTLDKILNALDHDIPIEIVPDTQHQGEDQDPFGEDEEDSEEGTEKTQGTKEKDEEKPTKRRGRKPGKGKGKAKVKKAKKEEPPKVVPTHKHSWRLESRSFVRKLTPDLAQEFATMTPFEGDRDIQTARYEYHRRCMEEGTYRGSEWASAKCEKDGKTYRVNGAHTSKSAHDLFEEKKEVKGEPEIWVRRYVCPTLEDVAALWTTFDPKRATRTKQDELKSFAAVDKRLLDMAPRIRSLVNSGIAFAHWEKTYRKQDTPAQASLLIDNVDFATWAARNFTPKTAEDRRDWKHIFRMSVFAAMFLTFRKDQKACGEFWLSIRDIRLEDSKTAPRKALYRWLNAVTLGRVGKEDKKKTSERAIFLYCLKAWNAWREGKTSHSYAFEEGHKTPEVV